MYRAETLQVGEELNGTGHREVSNSWAHAPGGITIKSNEDPGNVGVPQLVKYMRFM